MKNKTFIYNWFIKFHQRFYHEKKDIPSLISLWQKKLKDIISLLNRETKIDFVWKSLMECIPYKSNYHSNFFHSLSHSFLFLISPPSLDLLLYNARNLVDGFFVSALFLLLSIFSSFKLSLWVLIKIIFIS